MRIPILGYVVALISQRPSIPGTGGEGRLVVESATAEFNDGQVALRLPSQNMIFHALTGLQFNFDLQRLGLAAKLCALDCVLGDRAIGVCRRLILFRRAQAQKVSARRQVLEIERTVVVRDFLVVAQRFIRRRRFSRDQVDANPLW